MHSPFFYKRKSCHFAPYQKLSRSPKAQSIPDANIFSEYESSHPLTVKHFKQMQDGTYWFQRLLTIESSFMRNVKDIPKQVISHLKNLNG